MRTVNVSALLLLAAATALSQAPSVVDKQPAGRRLALLIGNQNYARLRPLPAVKQELDLMRAALDSVKFDVTLVSNKNLADLAGAIDAFVAKVQPGDICLVYYSGYAAHDKDEDYILSVDFDPAAGSLADTAYPITTVAKFLEQHKAALKMFFLEGARRIEANMPNGDPGLVIPSNADLSEVLFGIPTGQSQLIDTPPDQAGLFTTILAQLIGRQCLHINDLMPQVLSAVMQKGSSQRPTMGGTLTRTEFTFVDCPPPPPVTTSSRFLTNRIDREDYTFIQPGSFKMGCVPSDTKCDKAEKPQHEVKLTKGFWMGLNEVKVVSYKKFVAAEKSGKKPRRMPGAVDWNKKWEKDDQPISNMTWEDARDYCSWAGGRLPTEAEWEYAARAGKADEIYPFPLEQARDKANFAGKFGAKDIWDLSAAPVRQFDPNAWGLFDMAGNLWEFVNDWFLETYYSSSPPVDPPGPPAGKLHVRRGGSFDSDPKKHLRISIREGYPAANNVGFRCVLDDTPETKRNLQIP